MELSLEKQKSSLMERSVPGGQAPSGGRSDNFQSQVATMEMQVLNEKQRAELANVK